MWALTLASPTVLKIQRWEAVSLSPNFLTILLNTESYCFVTFVDFNFFAAAFGNTDVASYKDPATAIGVAMQSAADKAKTFGANPDSTLIGGNINVLRDAWQASKDAGKTWQIWTGATVMAPQIPPSLLRCKDSVPAEFSASMQAYCDGVLKLPTAGLFRAAAAMDLYRQPWNPDDFGGFAVERAAIAEVAKNNANNPVILAGDVHDGWAYTTYEGGIVGPGKPVAVHLVCPGVTSPGWGPLVGGAFPGSPVEAALGTDGVFEMVSKLFKNGNPGMVYGNVQAKGFVAVKMTKVSCIRRQRASGYASETNNFCPHSFLD